MAGSEITARRLELQLASSPAWIGYEHIPALTASGCLTSYRTCTKYTAAGRIRHIQHASNAGAIRNHSVETLILYDLTFSARNRNRNRNGYPADFSERQTTGPFYHSNNLTTGKQGRRRPSPPQPAPRHPTPFGHRVVARVLIAPPLVTCAGHQTLLALTHLPPQTLHNARSRLSSHGPVRYPDR